MKTAPIINYTDLSTKTNINHKGKALFTKELSHIFDTDHRLSLIEKIEVRGLEKTKNSKALDELWNIFDGNLGFDIYRAYYAILDSNDEVNNAAKNALIALAGGKSTNIITNLKNMNKEGSKSYSHGLKFIADLIQGCKDNAGNHNKKALNLLGELETGGLNSFKIPIYIKFCKNNDGRIDNKRLDILKDFISKGYHVHAGIIADIPNSENKITPERLNFFYNVMGKYKKEELKPDTLTLLQELLQGTKDSVNDNEIKMLNEHFEELLNKDKSVKLGADYFKTNNNQISQNNVDLIFNQILPSLKVQGLDVKFTPDLLKDNSGQITRSNFLQFSKIGHKYSKKLIEKFAKVKEMKDSDGNINPKFIDFINENNLYFIESLDVPYPVEILKETLRIAKNPNGTTNWEVVNDIFDTIYSLFKMKGYELHIPFESPTETIDRDSYKETYWLCSRLEKMIGADKGNINKKITEKIKNMSETNSGWEELLKTLQGETFDKIIEGKNLYKADELLNVMEQLNDAEKLDSINLNSPIQDFDSLFWAIIEAPKTEENKETYSKVMKLLSNVKGLDYNQKDKNGISILEKVINAENEELLDVIIDNSENLNYYPELDWAYNGIQNNKFKEKAKSLDLRFVDLEQSARLCSVKTFDRLKSQLDSPLCNKEKVIERLFDILKEQKGTVAPPDVYAYHLLEEYGDDISKGLFDDIAKWQIDERTKRTGLA